MGLFKSSKRKPISFSVSMKGFSNGKEVPLKETDSNLDDVKPMFYYKELKSEIKPIENELVDTVVNARKEKDIETKVKLLRQSLLLFDKLETTCRNMGSEYAEYFEKNWMHCHNSKTPDFCCIDPIIKELKSLT